MTFADHVPRPPTSVSIKLPTSLLCKNISPYLSLHEPGSCRCSMHKLTDFVYGSTPVLLCSLSGKVKRYISNVLAIAAKQCRACCKCRAGNDAPLHSSMMSDFHRTALWQGLELQLIGFIMSGIMAVLNLLCKLVRGFEYSYTDWICLLLAVRNIYHLYCGSG